VALTLAADHLPGGACVGYDTIHVGVQCRAKPRELLGLTPGGAATAGWTLECVARPGAGGAPDLAGPYVQGPPGGRFVYLSWGSVDADGAFTMFRRAKLLLAAVPSDVLTAAVAAGRLVGRLGLSDAEGRPLCARVVPPAIRWST
jgi:Family of unknown function (DUF5990)